MISPHINPCFPLQSTIASSLLLKMSGLKEVLKAVNFAAVKHTRQRRKDGKDTPYINHPVGVANILADEGGVDDPVVIQSALLHDTVEDTDTTLDEIEEHFGPKIRG